MSFFGLESSGAASISSASASLSSSLLQPSLYGTLIVIFIKARNLPNRRTLGKQNPYCIARVGTDAKRSHADIRGGQVPKWDHEVRFELRDVADHRSIKISLLDENESKPELIGDTTISLEKVFESHPSEGYDAWHELEYRGKYAGEVYLEMTFYPTKQAALSSSTYRKSKPSLRKSKSTSSAVQPGLEYEELNDFPSLAASVDLRTLPPQQQRHFAESLGSSTSSSCHSMRSSTGSTASSLRSSANSSSSRRRELPDPPNTVAAPDKKPSPQASLSGSKKSPRRKPVVANDDTIKASNRDVLAAIEGIHLDDEYQGPIELPFSPNDYSKRRGSPGRAKSSRNSLVSEQDYVPTPPKHLSISSNSSSNTGTPRKDEILDFSSYAPEPVLKPARERKVLPSTPNELSAISRGDSSLGHDPTVMMPMNKPTGAGASKGRETLASQINLGYGASVFRKLFGTNGSEEKVNEPLNFPEKPPKIPIGMSEAEYRVVEGVEEDPFYYRDYR